MIGLKSYLKVKGKPTQSNEKTVKRQRLLNQTVSDKAKVGKRPRESLDDIHDPKDQIKVKDTPSKPIVLPTIPAYQKFAHLVEPRQPQLKLPTELILLEKMFHALETVLMFNKARGQPSIFVKIQKAVENICHRTFELQHLAKLFTLYPNLYILNPVKFLDDHKKMVHSISLDFPRESTKGAFHFETLKLDRELRIRKKLFHDELEKYVQNEHDKFLLKNGYKVDSGFHPLFDLEKEVAPVELDPNPLFVKKIIAEPIVEPVQEPKKEKEEAKEPVLVKLQKPMSKAEALLQRIREKERLRQAEKKPRSSQQEQELLLASRMCDVVKSMHFYYIQEQRHGMMLSELVPYLINNHKVVISKQDMVYCIRKIAELNPTACKIVKLHSGEECVRWNRDIPVKDTISLIKKHQEDLKEN